MVIESQCDIMWLSECSSRDGVGEHNGKKCSRRQVCREGLSDHLVVDLNRTVGFLLFFIIILIKTLTILNYLIAVAKGGTLLAPSLAQNSMVFPLWGVFQVHE